MIVLYILIFVSNQATPIHNPFQRLYRQKYHKEKDKIHVIYDTLETLQVKATQEAISDVSDHYTHFSRQQNRAKQSVLWINWINV